ncbi:hypothetical protein CCAN12_700034 [Capnocytophaga canimorsus]|uniref:Uncharacterized protein n=1 Tax=Capnocytophaga canimorsus TaxID=28188 RepID=A0A0B7HHN3_9FLAO|nr:hypothetical protein CCAN12_700034 [Capnocytophaga canimorsus]
MLEQLQEKAHKKQG